MTEYKKEGVLFKYIQDAKEILQECTIIYKKVNEDREMLGKLIFKFHNYKFWLKVAKISNIKKNTI